MLRPTLIVPLGLLQNQNHAATGSAFIKLAQEPGRLPAGEKLDHAQLTKVMPQILANDANFRAGKCDSANFRRDILAILQLHASDEEFDSAWNAMLGDLTKLSFQLAEIKKQNEHIDIIWVSKTNPIHARAIRTAIGSEEKNVDANVSLLSGNPFFTSYQSEALKKDLQKLRILLFMKRL